MTCFKSLPAATLVVALPPPMARAERSSQLVCKAECASCHNADRTRAPATQAGPVIVGGMLYFNPGYSNGGGNADMYCWPSAHLTAIERNSGRVRLPLTHN